MSRLRVAVIGAGNWGWNHVRTLYAMPDVELAAVCDTSAKRREQVGRQFPGVPVTDGAEQAMKGADAVVVATPAGAHAPLALAAIDRGLPVLVEKPFALTVADAEAVAERAAATGVPVLVGHLLLFHPVIERLRAMIRAGELGTIYYLYSQRVNLGQVRPDENALWSFGPHDVSVALDLLGAAPVRVSAQGSSYLQKGIEDVVFLTMHFASGVMAHAQMSWLDPHKERRLTVVGSRKMVVFDDMEPREKLRIYDKGVDRPPEYRSYGESLAIREGDVLVPRVPNAEPLAAELRHFVAVAGRTAAPVVGPAAGVEVVRVLAAASASLDAGGRAIEVAPASPRGEPAP